MAGEDVHRLTNSGLSRMCKPLNGYELSSKYDEDVAFGNN
jgi:hypothetical protein